MHLYFFNINLNLQRCKREQLQKIDWHRPLYKIIKRTDHTYQIDLSSDQPNQILS